MKLAIFDLDNTLIAGDSDYLWGQYLCERGHIDADRHRELHREYYEDYRAGRLDIRAFLRFQLKPLAQYPLESLLEWRADYLEDKIRPILLPRAAALLDEHRAKGHTLLIITATNRFITEPIARMLKVENLIASEPEMRDGRYTGNVSGTPAYREGKVQRLEQWLSERHAHLEESWFYSDSHNDLTLLARVDHPVAVDPDIMLREESIRRGWPIITLR